MNNRIAPFYDSDRSAAQLHYQAQLSRVCTMKEVCKMWCKDRKEVLRVLYSGGIYGEKRDTAEGELHGRWLFSYQSCVAKWGEPKG